MPKQAVADGRRSKRLPAKVVRHRLPRLKGAAQVPSRGPSRVFDGNVSGAVLGSPGCYANAAPGGGNLYAQNAQLPFWINFLGKAYKHAWVSPEGYIYFDGGLGGDPQNTVGPPVGAGQLHSLWDNYRSRLIAPFWSFASDQQPSGANPNFWGTTTYNGRPAFCVEWTEIVNGEYCIYPYTGDFSKTNTYELLIVRRPDRGYDDFDIVFNYGSIEYDHPGTDAGDQTTGYKCGDAAAAGWKTGSTAPGTSDLISNSWTYGAFVDGNQATGLIHNSLGDAQQGRYVWSIHNTQAAPHVDPYQTFGPPSDGSGPSWGVNPTGTQGEPVDSANGSYYTSTTDASLAGIGIPFTFTRSYNSADTTSGPLGPGWTHNLNASLTIKPNGDVTGRSGDGQQLQFTLNPDGSFSPPAGGRSTLTAVGGGYELVTHDQVHYLFTGQGRLTSERDRNGKGLAFAYNGDGTLATVTDSVGRNVTLSYTGGLLSQLTLPDGRNVRYAYDPGGHLQTVTDMRGGVTQYTYDSGGRLATLVDQNNHTVVQNTYGSDGRVTQQIDADGGISTYSWDAATSTSTYTDPRGNPWKDVYVDNVLIDRIDPLGNDTHYVYDSNLAVTAVIDPLGNETDMTYDARGNVLTKTAPFQCGVPFSAPCVETWTYDSFNNVSSYKNRAGGMTNYAYDGAGNLVSRTDPDPGTGRPVTLYGRDPAGTGLLTSTTDPNGRTTTYGYTNGNLTSVVLPLGEKTTMTYDGSGRMITRVDPRGNVTGADPAQYTTTFGYDNADHLRTTTDPLNHTTTSVYDAAGNLQSIQDANNHTTAYGYDNANHLTSMTTPDLTQTIYGYDPDGNLVSRKDGNNHTTRFAYDSANRVISTTLPGNQQWSYSYDANGNRVRTIDANNATTSYTYDALNRLTRTGYSDGTPTVTYSYDDNGNPTNIQNTTANEVFRYDALNRLTAAGQGGSYSFFYTYDAAGNVTQRTYPGNAVTNYTYDADERMKTVAGPPGTTTYAYDAAGNLATATLPATNGYVETRSYDRAGRLTEVKTQKGTSVLADVTTTLDGVGNPLSVVRTGATALTANYTYDSRDRLTEVCFQASPCTGGSSPFIRWTYDPAGNRLTEARPTGTTNYTYDVNDRMLTAGSTALTYDANGNETSAGAVTFAHNAANQLKSTTNGRTTTTYTYDGGGHRLSASTGTQTASTTNYSWDLLDSIPQIAVEQDGAGGILRTYLYGLDRIAMTTGGASYFYHYDQLGSVINLTNSTGVTQWTDSYEPFGAVRTETKNSNKAPTNFMKFTGEYLDATGLYHLRARQYDVTTGRFLSPDPLQPVTGSPYTGAYSYISNRPTFGTDPTGRCFAICGIVGAVVNTAVYAVETAVTDESFSWTGAAQAAGEGFVIGATGGLGATVGREVLGGVVRATTAKVIGSTVAGAVGGYAATQARSLAKGCGFASSGEALRGALVGAAGTGFGEARFGQVGFEVRTIRGIFRNQPNTKRIWGGAIAGSAMDAAVGPKSSCDVGADGK